MCQKLSNIFLWRLIPIMRKSIFIGINDILAGALKDKRVGDVVSFYVKDPTGTKMSPYNVQFRGKVVQVLPKNHGTLLLVKNLDVDNNLYLLPGWTIVPIWLSECGQSGVLATWKPDLDLSTHIQDYQAHLEREANNCMAL